MTLQKTARESAFHQAGRAAIAGMFVGARPSNLNRVCVALAGQLAEAIVELLDDHFDLVDAAADVRNGKDMLSYAAEHDDAFKADLIGAGIDPGDWHIPVRHVRVTLRLLRETWSQVVQTADAMIQQAAWAATRDRDFAVAHDAAPQP